MTLLLSLVLLVDGHHALPANFPASACSVSERPLRSIVSTGHRRQRLRAMAVLRRCHFTLPTAQLRLDPDPEIRLSAWRVALADKSPNDPMWNLALESLPHRHGRSILSWRLDSKRLQSVLVERP